jgi:thiol-disulfide isomerase/thioredoxin
VGRTKGAGLDSLERIVGEQQDYFPQLAFFPSLSDEEVARFVALGEKGVALQREGKTQEAEGAFRAQTEIYPANYEPWVSLAMLAAARGDDEIALERLQSAVVRGFTDLGGVGRAEVWSHLRSATRFLTLQDALPRLVEAERSWAAWSDLYTDRPPKDAASVARAYDTKRAAIVRMAPALGERQTRLWNRLVDRSAAALLEAYASSSADAEDLSLALDQLLALYGRDAGRSWQKLPPKSAAQLGHVAGLLLDKLPSPERRAGGLVLRSLSQWSAPTSETVSAIRAALDEVLERFADSPFAATAAEGRVRVELEAGSTGRAAAAYRSFRDANRGRPELLASVQSRLGVEALRLGGVPRLSVAALDGTTIDQASLAGKVVVYDFWATWCGPCRDEFPTLRKLDAKFGDGVQLVGVNLDHADEISKERLADWIVEQQLPGRQIHDGLGWDSELVRAFGVREIPFTVVATATGDVLAIGAHGKDLLRAVQAAQE